MLINSSLFYSYFFHINKSIFFGLWKVSNSWNMMNFSSKRHAKIKSELKERIIESSPAISSLFLFATYTFGLCVMKKYNHERKERRRRRRWGMKIVRKIFHFSSAYRKSSRFSLLTQYCVYVTFLSQCCFLFHFIYGTQIPRSYRLKKNHIGNIEKWN